MSIPHGRVACTLLAVAVGFTAPAWSNDSDPDETFVAATEELIGPQIILATQQPPVYPPAAEAGRFSGSVTLVAAVLKDGRIGHVKVVDCTRPKVGFEQAAVDAVKKWRFEPGQKDGEPVEFSLKFRLNFSGGGPGQKAQVSAGTFVEVSPPTAAGMTR
jgi:TonB family protein